MTDRQTDRPTDRPIDQDVESRACFGSLFLPRETVLRFLMHSQSHKLKSNVRVSHLPIPGKVDSQIEICL